MNNVHQKPNIFAGLKRRRGQRDSNSQRDPVSSGGIIEKDTTWSSNEEALNNSLNFRKKTKLSNE